MAQCMTGEMRPFDRRVAVECVDQLDQTDAGYPAQRLACFTERAEKWLP